MDRAGASRSLLDGLSFEAIYRGYDLSQDYAKFAAGTEETKLSQGEGRLKALPRKTNGADATVREPR
ncbi:MAG: hypothetical protein ACLU80_03675 [Dorea sp.]